MKKIKKGLLSLLSLLLCLSISGCGVYKPAITPEQITGGKLPSQNGNGENEENSFQVALVYRGMPFTAAEGIKAQWTDGQSYYTAPFDAKGVASVTGLDGDYQVTLSAVPEGFSYNPNVHVATNLNRAITIELYEAVTPAGTGKGLYTKDGCITLSATNVYRVVIENEDDVVYYQFSPQKSGTYSVESWVDVTAGQINPRIDVYNGSSAFKVFSHTLEGGGVSKGYTTNFKHTVEIAEEQIGQDFTFAIRASVKNELYPVTVDFAVQLDGEFYLDHRQKTMIIPRTVFEYTPNYDKQKYTFVGAETRSGNRFVFDGSKYKLNEQTGYYHLYDAETDTYGPILYAHITSACRFIDLSFYNIEDPGNAALTVSQGTENYKLFIQGFSKLESEGYAWVDELSEVEKQLYRNVMGYQHYVNSDGVYGVTQELKEFLQKFSVSQRLFADGNGWVEENPTIKVDAQEDDQWLFACGYYKEK